MPLDAYRKANRANWDDRVPFHIRAASYDVEGFVLDPARISRLVQFDRTEIGPVQGRSLLHLQCHIGTDTLSWARLGVNVTGVDFSARSIEVARSLSERSGTPGRFVVAELYDSPNVIKRRFDIVYTGGGALLWLPDMIGWARVVAGFLKRGGTFYIREFHPVMLALNMQRTDGILELAGPYFETAPVRLDEGGTYTDRQAAIEHTVTYQWNHGLGEIVTALISAGLGIEFVHEHRFSEWNAIPTMVRGDDGRWRLPPPLDDRVPLMYSIRAVKR